MDGSLYSRPSIRALHAFLICLLIILLLIKVEEPVDPKGKNDTGSVKADSPVLAMLKEQQADVFKYLMY